MIGRVLAQNLSTALVQQVVVDNRAGAAGSLGPGQVAKSPADGYTLLMGAMTSHSIKAALNPATVPFDKLQVMIETAPAAQPHIKSGKLRALATTTAQPVGTLPGVPTAGQSALPGFEVSSMFGVAAPAGTPPAVVAKLSSTLKTILGQPEVREQLLAQGAIATWTTPDDAAAAIRSEYAKWAKVIKDGNIKAE